MAKAPFPIIPELTGIAIAYRNRAMIADLVLPRVTPVSKEEFKTWLASRKPAPAPEAAPAATPAAEPAPQPEPAPAAQASTGA